MEPQGTGIDIENIPDHRPLPNSVSEKEFAVTSPIQNHPAQWGFTGTYE